ncbi:hypothetical protein ABFA07_013582 [Porites harrisoni]
MAVDRFHGRVASVDAKP